MHKSKLFGAANDVLNETWSEPHGDEGPVAKAATKLAVSFPRVRELPHPVELRRMDHAVTRNSFRGFGINE